LRLLSITLMIDSFKAEWKTVKTDTIIPRSLHSAHIYKNQMIVLGGKTYDGGPSQGIHILNLGKVV